MPVSTPPPDLPDLPAMADLVVLFLEAARRGDVAMLAALLRADVPVDARDDRGHDALTLATYHDRRAATALLLDAGAAPDGAGGGNTPLMGVAFKGHSATATLLLDRGADPDARNAAGQTALMLAARFGQEGIVDLLLMRGADPALVDDAGDSAGRIAEAQGYMVLAIRLDG